MSDTINIKPEYIYITVPAEYIGVYHAILTMLADYGEDMLLDCKATCKEKNYNIVNCFNMFNAAIAARALHKTKLEETLIKYIKAKIQQIYKNTDKKVTFECVIDNAIYKEVYAIQGNTTIFKIDLANITNNVTKHIVNKSEWSVVTIPQLNPNIVYLEGGTVNLQGKVKRTIEYEWSDDRENTFETEELILKWKVKINDDPYIDIIGNSYNIESSTTTRDFYFIGYTDSLLGDNYTTSSIKVEQKNNDTPDTTINTIYGSIYFESKPEDLVQSIKNKVEEDESNFTKINEVQQHTSTHNNTYPINLIKGYKNACAFFLLPDINKYSGKTIVHCTGMFGDESLNNIGSNSINGVVISINNINYKLYAFMTNTYYGKVIFDFGLI